ncbi:PREDICTED: AP-4 complex accessory subunit tepsin-like [Amphimedon queenslandica]|uniref:AP-4 complex accessory subunit Tepsin VHS/ENTH-like domain-containing protein n=1 Tax=Amphimedon queenslandica TaxID=400682 RepID=A0A1X7UU28_AMPQE|nr:PREDICTED: AP-4 complex accessory subunit tepsin-like [Amphimedon queenslandica]|eukprot:XP_019852480.1 PREDICTED: AP-4 complex accessory subunit tepsin-like [Amphimedon queenslandica]
MAAGPSLTEKLANIQHMPSLIAATVASDKPVDGYLIRDIVKMSYESLQTRVFLQKYLINHLDSSRNVYVKIKVLKLVLSLLDEGHTDFHRNLQKTPEPFKSASMLKATSPEVAGDCGRIRDLANKVLDRLFDDPPSDRACPYGLPQQATGGSGSNIINGLGGASSSSSRDNTSSSLLGGRGGGGRIQGFGNTPSPTNNNNSSISSQLSSAVGNLFSSALGSSSSKDRTGLVIEKSYATTTPVPQYSSSLGGVGGGASSRSHNAHSFRGGGGGRGTWEDGEEKRTTGGGRDRSETAPSPTVVHRDGEQERRLVDQITTPGGVRVAPNREEMSSFLNRCKSLDCIAIVECLRDKLNSDSDQTILKSLFVVEGLARSDIQDIFSYLDLLLNELNSLSTSSNATIKAKSDKLLNLLGTTSTIHEQQQSQIHATSSSNDGALLTIEGEEGATATTDSSGLFAGLTITSSSPSPKTRPQSSSKTRNPPARKQQVEQQGHDLIDITLTQSPDTAPPSTGFEFLTAPTPSLPPSSSKDLLDMRPTDDESLFDPLVVSDREEEGLTTGGGGGSALLGGLMSLEGPVQPVMEPVQPVVLTSSSVPPANVMQGSTFMSGVPMATSMPSTGVSMVTSGPPPLMTSGYHQPHPPPVQSFPPGGGGSYYSVVSNRPVQRFPSKNPESDLISGDGDGFGFLSKTGKGSAFDFVKDEMKASMDGGKK